MAIKFRELSILFVLIISTGLSSCSFDKDDDSDDETAADSDQPSNTRNQSQSPENTESIIGGSGDRGLLLAPEQFSDMVEKSLEIRLGWTDHHGRFFDLVKQQLAVPLGGVDFLTSSTRNRLPKVQTHLIARRLAWEIAQVIVWREVDPNHPEPKQIFEHCDIVEDRPFRTSDANHSSDVQEQIRAGELRWETQLIEFYWRLLSRPPSQQEITMMKEAFLQVTGEYDGWNPPGWAVILYTILASSEFWYL